MAADVTITIDRPEPGTAVVTVIGQCDVYAAPELRSKLIGLINEARYRQVIDLRGVDLLDSTGLGVIVGAAKRAVAHGGRLALLVDLDSRPGKSLRVTGVHKAIPHAETVEGALELLAPKGAEPTPPEPDPRSTFWPPQVGDVWLGNLEKSIPQPLVCGAGGHLYVGGDGMAAERAYDSFGPLRLVWRDGAVVTAMHASELIA